ncbi:hypothetical protein BX666DRAFT_1881188 [Dichotomocladium elegans]|nr:hypothetical protein BX666DRAFT_1881188 [Dichotomocladium elegans]
MDLKDELSGVRCNLDIQPFLDELHEIYKVVELHVLRMYGELPLRSSDIFEASETIKDRSTEEDSIWRIQESEEYIRSIGNADIRQMWEDMTTVDVINCIIPPEQQKKLDEGQEDLAMRNDARERDPPNLPTNIVGNVALSDLTESNRSKALSSPPEEPMPSDKTLIPAYLRSLYVTMVRSIVHSTP